MSAMTQARPAWGRAPLLMGAILLAWPPDLVPDHGMHPGHLHGPH